MIIGHCKVTVNEWKRESRRGGIMAGDIVEESPVAYRGSRIPTDHGVGNQ